MPVPTIAVKESRADLLEIGPSTGLPGGVYGLVYALEKGLYVWKTGDQSSNVPANNDSDEWIAPSEDTSGKSGAWKRIVKERPEMSVIYHPEEATDSGTDQYGSEETTDPPSDDAVIARDFQSANTTTTPTLDGKTITDRDGNALWAGAINGVHELQYASGTDTYLLLDPIIATSQALVFPGTSSDPSLAFDTWRTPNADRPTFISASVGVQTDGTTSALAKVEVDESGGTTPDYVEHISADSDTGNNVFVEGQFATVIPAGGSYRIVNSDDPDGNNQIRTLREFTL